MDVQFSVPQAGSGERVTLPWSIAEWAAAQIAAEKNAPVAGKSDEGEDQNLGGS